jgi:Flp pilus assembly protein TadD
MFLEARGRFLEAIEQYQEELRIAPRDVRALNNLGRLLVAEGRPTEAIEVLQRAVELSSGAVTPTVNLAAAWLEQGDAARAETLARQVLAGHPGNPGAMRVLEKALKRGAR